MKHVTSRGTLICLVIALFACSSVPPVSSVDSQSISTVRKAFSTRAGEYQIGSHAWGNKENWNNFPLIAFGTGSIAAASFASGAAKANWLVGLALIAGAWALAYSTLAPETKQDAYSAGSSVFSCIDSATASVDETENKKLFGDRSALDTSVKNLSEALAAARANRARLPSGLSSDDQLRVLKSDAAINTAADALASANTELATAPTILPMLKNLYYSLDRKIQLAARGRILTPGEINGALTSAVSNLPGSAGGGNTKGGGASSGTLSQTLSPAPGDSQIPSVKDYVTSANAAAKLAADLEGNAIVRNNTYTRAVAGIKQCLANQ
ncbi:hypothetical protein [Paraburkholderia caledonica]|uniref:hypothetical protein n=1 Tax=Paraburkholderia caledonica TaxID=134536 RepID=UPI001178235B|nr:hypothetical protein [Paraburkholderia caledonica]